MRIGGWGRSRRVSGPLGCVVAGVAFSFTVACVLLVLVGAFMTVRSSDVFQQAVAELESSETAATALGEPMEVGMFFAGSISTSGDAGSADFSVPVSGPKADGRLYVVAFKDREGWHFTTLELALEPSGERLNLLTGR